MKRALAFILSAGLLAAAGISHAADHSAIHEKMMKMGGPKPDERVELKLPDPMKVMQKRMMRQHLYTVSEIAAALGANDMGKAASIARGLGWTPEEEERCNAVAELTGEPDFLSFGKAVHVAADELAASAEAGNRDNALMDLSRLIKNCNACHEKFRH
ncbi:MAG: cytochrome c [Thermodesulfobacteriota bacterium]|nr:MAG: cytochrome c [Thermodesulfobacteriota bacterium]